MQITMHSLFNSIAMEHSNKFFIALKQYQELTNNNLQWDILDHSSEENKRYFNLFSEKQKSGIISVVFLVMAIEGLINDYGFSHLGDHRFKELEKQSIIDKIVNIFAEVTGKQFPKDKKIYQNLNELISVRNTLVHSKSVEINMETMMRNDEEAEKQFNSYINSMLGNKRNKESKQKLSDEVLGNTYNAYNELKNFLEKNL